MSCVEGNSGDQIRNRPNRLVESEFKNKSTLKASSPNWKVLISDCKRVETLPPFGILRESLIFKDLAISDSGDDFPHKNSIEGEALSMAEEATEKERLEGIRF